MLLRQKGYYKENYFKISKENIMEDRLKKNLKDIEISIEEFGIVK